MEAAIKNNEHHNLSLITYQFFSGVTMDWKKETMSAAELEKRQREYMSAAMTMMKRSVPAATTATESETVTAAAPPSAGEAGTNGGRPGAAVPAAVSEPVKGEANEPTVRAEPAQADAPPQAAPVTPEPAEAPEAEPDAEPDGEPQQDEKPRPDGEPQPDTNYGVYTADELLNGEYNGDGLKKAAEILEEMTRNTAMMKKLADGGEDPDTTDFPDFSGSADCESEGSFREETEECREEKVPAEGSVASDE